MLRLLKPNLVRRFSHTHSKTIFPENNNKVIEDLIKKQNETLKDINKEIGLVGLMISILTVTIAFKPIR